MDTTTNPAPEQQRRPLLQWRPKDGTKVNVRDAFYSPARDVAYIGPKVIERAMFALNEECWEPWLKEYLDSQGVTVDTLIETAAPLKLAKLVNQVIKAPLQEAIPAAEFDKLPAAIQLLFYARIGQVFLAAMWSAVKDVNAPDSDPPATIESIMAMVEHELPSAFQQQGSANG